MLPIAHIDVFGVYVAPLVVVALACAVVWLALRRLADILRLIPLLWHPALFFTALYVIMLSIVVLAVGHSLIPGS